MKKVLHEEIRRIHQMMNINEDKDNHLLYLRRRLSGEAAYELFPQALSKASNILREKKHKWRGYDLEKFTNMIVSIMFDSFIHDFIVRGEDIPEDLASDEIWDYLRHTFSYEIEERYHEIMNEDNE